MNIVMPRHVDRETWIHRTAMPTYTGAASVSLAEPAEVARHVRSLRACVDADLEHRAPAYFLGGLRLSGALAEQVLRAYEEAE